MIKADDHIPRSLALAGHLDIPERVIHEPLVVDAMSLHSGLWIQLNLHLRLDLVRNLRGRNRCGRRFRSGFWVGLDDPRQRPDILRFNLLNLLLNNRLRRLQIELLRERFVLRRFVGRFLGRIFAFAIAAAVAVGGWVGLV